MGGNSREGDGSGGQVGQLAWAVWLLLVVAGYYVLNGHYPRHFRWYAWRGWQALGPMAGRLPAYLLAVGASGLVLLSGVGYGWLLTRARHPGDALATGLGLGLVGGALFGVGTLAPLGPAVALAVCLPGCLLAGLRLRRGPALALPAGPGLLRGLICLFLLLAFLGALAPETGTDALAEHLPAVRHLAEQGSWREFNASGASYYPPLIHLLYAAAWSMGGEVASRLLGLWLLVLCLPLVRELAVRCGLSESAAEAAALLYASHLLVGIYATKCYLDITFTYFVLGALLCGARWGADPGGGQERMALWFAGLCAASRPHGLIVLGLVGLAILGLAIARRSGWQGVVLTGLAVLALCVAPWTLRNYLWTGNPVYPFMSVSMVQTSIEGAGRGLPRLLGLPFALTFDESAFILPWGPLALALVPLGLPRLRWSWGLGVVLALALAYLLVWFWTIQNVRYLLPLVALAAVGCAAGLEVAWRSGGLLRGCAVGAVGLVLLGNLAVLLMGSQQYDHRGLAQKLPVIVGYQSPEAYWRANVPWAAVVRFVNEARAPGEPVLLHHGTTPYLRLKGPHVRLRQGEVASGSATLWGRLRADGVRYVVVREPAAGQRFAGERWLERARVVYRAGGYSVRELPWP